MYRVKAAGSPDIVLRVEAIQVHVKWQADVKHKKTAVNIVDKNNK